MAKNSRRSRLLEAPVSSDALEEAYSSRKRQRTSSAATPTRARTRKTASSTNVVDVEIHHSMPGRPDTVDTTAIKYYSSAQQIYDQMLQSYKLIFSTGPAGTGKSHIALNRAGLMLIEKSIQSILVCRPAVEAGGGLGFMPGTMEEKIAPYFNSVTKILNKRLGPSFVENLKKSGGIELAPLEFLRGETYNNTFMILDESQNATHDQLKTFLTRIGKNCVVAINGDPEQIDLKHKSDSGLATALEILSGMNGFTHFEFQPEDIIRSQLVKDIILRYRAWSMSK